jgi:hypothetical protein
MKILLPLIICMSLVSCGKDGKNGQNGLPGIQGEAGAKGDKGDKGDTGSAGINAAAIPVKFCPNLVDRYGVQYSEHGLCIANKIYAVYSHNNQAALVELSEGTYQTTTPAGGNCTFTVLPNCVIE